MAAISQKEYLKRYLSKDGKKKKKKQKIPKANKIRIVEDILDLHAIEPQGSMESDHEIGEDAPQIAEIIDERPDHVKREELFRTNKWRAIEDSNETLQGKGLLLEANHSAIVAPTVRHPQRHDSDSDLSPDRDGNRANKPSRKVAEDSDLDLSPPRSQTNQFDERRSGRDRDSQSSSHRQSQDSDIDLSPPRRNQQPSMRVDSDLDLSPPRPKTSKIDDLSGKARNSRDLSRSRTKHTDWKESPKKERQKTSEKHSSTLSGLKAGLQDSSHLRKELMDVKMKENRFFEKVSDELSGRGAETVFRDKKTGRKRDLKEEKRKQREDEQQKAEQQEKYMEWGKGLKQGEDQAKRLEEDLYEMSKPLARYSDDIDLENHLKEQEREGDPMLEYVKKRKKKEKGSTTVLPVYQGPPPPPNRFNIMPGYRWDGVDRSNGFESKYFKLQANKEAVSVDAYKWSIQDM